MCSNVPAEVGKIGPGKTGAWQVVIRHPALVSAGRTLPAKPGIIIIRIAVAGSAFMKYRITWLNTRTRALLKTQKIRALMNII